MDVRMSLPPRGEGGPTKLVDEGVIMRTNIDKRLTYNSQQLRKNMTPEEKHIWYDFLKKLPVTVNRQRKIGCYIVDFYISKLIIVIEIDGSQHYEPDNKLLDKKRDSYLRAFGILVLRYTNFDVHDNFDGVCRDIEKHIRARELSPHPPAEPVLLPHEGEG
ncbi:MAG: DUF559 domain-containing protein [Clostridia bacterium]|nr:DUF559 domain-containing protein [Clostridia bacterium]